MRVPFDQNGAEENELEPSAAATPAGPTESDLFQVALDHYFHQNNLYWQNARILFAVQVGALGAAGGLLGNNDKLAMALLAGAFIITFILSRLSLKYRMDRDANKDTILEPFGRAHGVRLTVDRRVLFTGNRSLRTMFFLFLLADLIFLLWIASSYYPFREIYFDFIHALPFGSVD